MCDPTYLVRGLDDVIEDLLNEFPKISQPYAGMFGGHEETESSENVDVYVDIGGGYKSVSSDVLMRIR